MNKLAWKPWHEVVKLRDDLRTGELTLQMFAADLYEVIAQNKKQPVYEIPENFFSLTFPTYNLRQLVRDVMLRLAGKNDKAVRQLELTYGGGKTHTLITLRHLVYDPTNLPDLPAVKEFVEAIGQVPPKSRVVGLCFDKIDVDKGMEVTAPDGSKRWLKQPWSILAYQIAGNAGLSLLHVDGKAEERESAPAENLLTDLLEIPVKEDLGVLILIDEVLMYAREKIAQDREWRVKLVNFFQYLTQAVTKVNRCCVVASLLASDPNKSDTYGKEIIGELYDIFKRQREEAVEPVVKEDVAEVLRRRFFTPTSLKDRDSYRQHVMAALKGISAIDEQTSKQGAEAEERFFKSFPFHPDLTEVFYGKWTTLDRFQRTRGVLRTFALALREAEKWDISPLVGPSVFLTDPKKTGLSDAARELVTVADTEETEGKKQAWTGILDGEFTRARQIQFESVGLKYREIEQAVVATFLHSQPIGQNAKTRDLIVLLGTTRPDKIELEKGLARWAQYSYWLDDLNTATTDDQLPSTWRLGNRPNLNQMHANAARNISDEIVRSRLLDEIGKVKSLSANASGNGIKVHTLPSKPKDIEDDGLFHYAILGPNAASDSGKPSSLAKKFLDETTDSDKPRVYRNSVILLVPSKDGLELASARIREYLAWEVVRDEIGKQQAEGSVDPARAQTMQINIEKSKGRIPESIKQAYCIVVTVSEKNEVHAFKITVAEDQHFNLIKSNKLSRIQDTAVTAEALLPDGPYNLWREGETSRRVKDLSGAFAQMPHLPKMLRSSAITETLVDGCERGAFVLRLTRPDGSFRTWWMQRPDETSMQDSAMELVLPQHAELSEFPASLLIPGRLPELWNASEITVSVVENYFNGKTVVPIDKGGYKEPFFVPSVSKESIEKTITIAVESGLLWLISGPASILAEPIPSGVLSSSAILALPPVAVSAASILTENLPEAWKDGQSNALSIASALSFKVGKTLPWKVVRDVIGSAIQARFIELTEESITWPCEFPSAQFAKFREAKVTHSSGGGSGGGSTPKPDRKTFVAEAELTASEMQDLGDIIPKLTDVKAKTSTPIRFVVRVEVGDGASTPSEDTKKLYDAVLANVNSELILK